MAKDKELADHERAHSGVPGSRVKHGANAVKNPAPKLSAAAKSAKNNEYLTPIPDPGEGGWGK